MHPRGSGEAARRAKRGRRFSCLSRLAPSVTRVAICVSRVLLDELQKKETARSLTLWRCHQSITTAARKRKLEYSIKCTTFSSTQDRAQGLSPPSNEDNTVAKNEGFILTPRVLFGSFFPILSDLSLFLRVGAFTLDAMFCSTNPSTQRSLSSSRLFR